MLVLLLGSLDEPFSRLFLLCTYPFVSPSSVLGHQPHGKKFKTGVGDSRHDDASYVVTSRKIGRSWATCLVPRQKPHFALEARF